MGKFEVTGNQSDKWKFSSRQSWAAQAVQIELDARKLESCTDANTIAEAYRYLAVSELTSLMTSPPAPLLPGEGSNIPPFPRREGGLGGLGRINYLKESEARKLVENPVPDFTLRYETNASQRVLDLTRCHPYLVQLLCQEIVAYKNEREPAVRRLATLGDVEAAIPEALASGSLFFSDIENNQIDGPGVAILRYLAAGGEGATVSRELLMRQFPDSLAETLELLERRELIESVNGNYRFQVELIRRWFTQT